MALKPLKPCKVSKDGFVVVDIENWPDGSLLTINTCWRNASGAAEHHRNGPYPQGAGNWSDWWNWICQRSISDCRFAKLHAHNGGGWDWISLVHWLLTDGKIESDNISICAVGSKIITATVKVRPKHSIKLCDSLPLLRSSLDKLGKKFLGRGKVELGDKLPHEIYLENPELFRKYEDEDTELLLGILESALCIVRENVAEIDTFAATIGGTAMKVFRTIGFPDEITVPWKPELKEFLRRGYSGGRVECFRPGVYPSIKVYDINSLYPYAMQTAYVPISDRTIPVKAGHVIKAGEVGVYEVRWEQNRRDIPPILTMKGNGEYEGNNIVFSPELLLLREVDKSAVIEITSGFIFPDVSVLFADYVTKLYTLRLADPGGPLSEICKYLLNSLYGKFGQHPEKEKAFACNDVAELYEAIERGGVIRPLNGAAGVYLERAEKEFGKRDKSKTAIAGDMNPVYGITEESHVEYEHVGIAGMITSTARAILLRGICDDFSNVVYCDTDSIHTAGELPPEIVGKSIGQFKLEFVGSGAYAGKKLYGLSEYLPPGVHGAKREKVRAKGVSVGGRNGASLTYDELCDICNGESKLRTYKQPTTVMELFAGKKPCVFQTRKRTLRKTAKERYGKAIKT